MKKYKIYWFFRKIYDKYIRIKDESIIPPGFYCHFATKAQSCPYWDQNPYACYSENGYCSFIGEGDWHQKHMSLLFDMCKECGVKDEIEDDLIWEEQICG